MYDLGIVNASRADQPGLCNVWIRDGVIARITDSNQLFEAGAVVDAVGRMLMPGVIDAHVHARDPGYTHKEDFTTSSRAAVAGGVTTFIAMPNSNPPLTTCGAIRMAQRRIEQAGKIDVELCGATLCAYPGNTQFLTESGVVCLDVYDDPYAYGSDHWISLFLEAKKAGLPLCFYLMDSSLEKHRKSEANARGEDEISVFTGATDGYTEAISIARIFPLAAYFDVPVVLRMVSTGRGIDMIRTMRRIYPSARVYTEVCVHYLFLEKDALREKGACAHVHPPLRTMDDIRLLWKGIKDGTVDYIASDHAPHAIFEKETDKLSACASGMIGLETMLPLLLQAQSEGLLTYKDIQRLLCKKPAEIYGLKGKKGFIREGLQADLVLINQEEVWRIPKTSYSKGVNNPFVGKEIHGRPCMTVVKGRIAMKNGIVNI